MASNLLASTIKQRTRQRGREESSTRNIFEEFAIAVSLDVTPYTVSTTNRIAAQFRFTRVCSIRYVLTKRAEEKLSVLPDTETKERYDGLALQGCSNRWTMD